MFGSYKYFKDLYIAVFIIFGIAVVGSVGFMVLEGYSFGEAIYMTVITVSTVGFSEVRKLSPEGRYFTIFLIFTSFGTFAYAISSLSKYIFTGEYGRYYKKYKMDQQIDKLKGHVIICGSGNNGSEAINSLLAHPRELCVIENDQEKIETLRDKKIPFIDGDATDEEVLISAGVEFAESLITTLPKDTDNVFVTLTARGLNEKLKIVSRCTLDSSQSKLKRAGADSIVMPDKVGGVRMAGFIINQNISRFLDKISVADASEEYLREVLGSEIPEELRSKPVGDIINFYGTECKLMAIKKGSGEFLINPDNTSTISENCELYFLGNKAQIKELRDKLEESE